MKKIIKITYLFVATLLFLVSCQNEETVEEPKVIFKFKFDNTQERLDNLGNPSPMPDNHAGQNPIFNSISAHYIELAPSALTQLGKGNILYQAPEVNTGGESAIDFEKSILVGENEIFLEVPISQVQKGLYDYLRVSLSYQNYDISFRHEGVDYESTLASFIGFNTYIKGFMIKNQNLNVNANKKQGFWAFETLGDVQQGEAAQTTVPNPIASTSPIPAGSCVVTAKFDKAFEITGNETKDIIVTISLSTNNSFEWEDNNGNGFWEPTEDENVVDMGIRGMKILVD